MREREDIFFDDIYSMQIAFERRMPLPGFPDFHVITVPGSGT